MSKKPENNMILSDQVKQWLIEVEKRVTEIENGEGELISGDQVFAEIRQKWISSSNLKRI